MLLGFTNSISRWYSQFVGTISSEMSVMQPHHYAVGLIFCIVVGYMLLRGRN